MRKQAGKFHGYFLKDEPGRPEHTLCIAVGRTTIESQDDLEAVVADSDLVKLRNNLCPSLVERADAGVGGRHRVCLRPESAIRPLTLLGMRHRLGCRLVLSFGLLRCALLLEGLTGLLGHSLPRRLI